MTALRLLSKIYILLLLTLLPVSAQAFTLDSYTTASRLSQGKLVKISVPTDGLYRISASQLRSAGFTDATRVRIYGYGGHRHSDVLSNSTYIDDLPQVPYAIDSDGSLVFYALGAGQWVKKSTQVTVYQQNDFSDYGYYFIGEALDDEGPAAEFATTATGAAADETSVYIARVHHEQERVCTPGEAGPMLLGEDFYYTRNRTISLKTPDTANDYDGNAMFHVSFVSNITEAGSSLAFNVNGTAIKSTTDDAISATSSSHYIHGTETTAAHFFSPELLGDGTTNIEIKLNLTSNCSGAWLNYISLNYPRRLVMRDEGYLTFNSAKTHLTMEGADATTEIWDVTDPQNIAKVNFTLSGNKASWKTSTPGERHYAAFRRGADITEVEVAGTVAQQNLHSHRDLDMVIVAPAAYADDAERLAELHRNDGIDPLNVIVVAPEQIYNEFSSGTPDPGALRRYFKMLYDRGNASDDATPLRYAILMGRTTIDNRGLTSSAPSYPTIPSWMPWDNRASLSDNEGYCTDDVTAMLEDGSGSALRNDKLSIAIGRIPVTDTSESRDIVDKAIQYARSAKKTAWKHRYLFLADDQDNSVHLRQTEKMISQFDGADGTQHLVRKVYLDAYPFNGSEYPEARTTMYRYLDEGVVWWNFIGHANTTGWTGEHILSYSDLNNMYLRHWPFIYAATCDFLRLDGTSFTGGEILYKERYGGAIGIISAVRPVYISDNAMLSNAIGRALAMRDDNGRVLTPGEIYRRAKNDIRDTAGNPTGDTNRLRYVFIGDPALPLAMPSDIVRLDKIDGTAIGNDAGDALPIMQALGQCAVEGSVVTPAGTLRDDFNGVVLIEIFDSERTRTTLASRESSTEENFEDYGERIYCGSATVTNGRFSLTVSMPGEVSQNFRPAAMSLYAYSTDDDSEAVGLCRDFYVYGYNEPEVPDTNRPQIESMVLNHSSFSSGDTVDPSPMLIAAVRDDVGINLSNAGVGHQMMAMLDGKQAFTDLSQFYTPASDGSASGVINYPFSDLATGNHTLSLRVWDTSGNSATSEIDFFVDEKVAPKIFDVYTDANPASTQANFYLTHDRPDAMVSVTVTVYNLLGHPVWTGSAQGINDMFLSVPVTWDLTDGAGRRVGRGIYLYSASISTDGETYQTASRRIAVTAQ